MKFYYDQGSRELSILKKGDKVKVKNFSGKKWLDGTIIGINRYPRSYKVQLTNSYTIVTRNRKHLIKITTVACTTPAAVIGSSSNDKIDNTCQSCSNANVSKDSEQNKCITRSGRFVKPKIRLDL